MIRKNGPTAGVLRMLWIAGVLALLVYATTELRAAHLHHIRGTRWVDNPVDSAR